MADSNITKRALASALKELMESTPFSKITVSDICAKCNMNRKSFYYHFKDKFDLVNWIFDVEYLCGTGYVYDVIADFDGKPSITLTEFAEQCRYEEDIAQLRQLLKQLKRYLQDNRIVTMSLKPQNILCHRISESEVIPVVCDNIGESTLIPLATWSKWCCLRKQERLWKRFIAQPALAIALQKDLQPRESKTLALTSREA